MSNTYFKHKSLHKYTRAARGQDGVEIKSMIDLVLVKKDMLKYEQDVRMVRGMECEIRLLRAWIKRRDVVIEDRRIRNEKLREHQYRQGYARSLEVKGVERDGDNKVRHMCEEVKWAMIESTREVCGSVRVVGKNPKNVWWNDEVKATVRRKEAAWKVLVASDEEAKER